MSYYRIEKIMQYTESAYVETEDGDELTCDDVSDLTEEFIEEHDHSCYDIRIIEISKERYEEES